MKSINGILGGILMLASSICFAGPININSADEKALASLNGIGPAKAAAIIAHRKTNGPFSSIEELERVKGIGKKTVEMNRDMLTVTDEPAE